MEPLVFHLSFKAMSSWCLKYLLWALLAGLAIALVMGLALFFLTQLPPEMLLTPFILGIIPIALMAGFFLPTILIICFLYAKLLHYQIDDSGFTQRIGPFKTHAEWLEIKSVYPRQFLNNLELTEIELLSNYQTLTVYTCFLDNPDEFREMLRHYASDDYITKK